jgi:hypothetical protein
MAATIRLRISGGPCGSGGTKADLGIMTRQRQTLGSGGVKADPVIVAAQSQSLTYPRNKTNIAAISNTD